MPTVRLIITGKVQGVYFRASAKAVADSLALGGWVRNTPEGGVEVLASGKEEPMQQFIQWCHEGPAGAKVSRVEWEYREEVFFEYFSIRH